MKRQVEMAFFDAHNLFLVHRRVHRCLPVLGLEMVAAVAVIRTCSEPKEIILSEFEQNTS